MEKRDLKTWRRVFGKVKGAFGETDFDKKVIKVDRSKHKNKALYNVPKKDSSLINTLVHENMHAEYPKMTEKQVKKKTRTKLKKMGRKQKLKVYSQFK